MKGHKLLKTIIIVLLLNTVVIGGWVFLFKYIKGLESKTLEIKSEILENERRVSNIRSLEKLLVDISEERAGLEKAFLSSENLIEFIKTLEDLSGKTQTEISITGAVLSSAGGPDFQFKILGSFGEVFHYLVLLENTPFQLSFNRLQIQKLTPEQQKLQETKKTWQGVFNIKVLSYL